MTGHCEHGVSGIKKYGGKTKLLRDVEESRVHEPLQAAAPHENESERDEPIPLGERVCINPFGLSDASDDDDDEAAGELDVLVASFAPERITQDPRHPLRFWKAW